MSAFLRLLRDSAQDGWRYRVEEADDDIVVVEEEGGPAAATSRECRKQATRKRTSISTRSGFTEPCVQGELAASLCVV